MRDRLLEELQASDNAFAILTAAHILTKRTTHKPTDRLARKITIMRLLYRNGWDKQKIDNFFRVIDWLMQLPEDLTIDFTKEVKLLREEQEMKYITSIEQLAMAEGRQEGRTGGMIEMFLNMLTMRFPNFDFQAYKDKISNAAEEQLNRYSAKLFTAKTPEEVFADDEKK